MSQLCGYSAIQKLFSGTNQVNTCILFCCYAQLTLWTLLGRNGGVRFHETSLSNSLVLKLISACSEATQQASPPNTNAQWWHGRCLWLQNTPQANDIQCEQSSIFDIRINHQIGLHVVTELNEFCSSQLVSVLSKMRERRKHELGREEKEKKKEGGSCAKLGVGVMAGEITSKASVVSVVEPRRRLR